MILLNQSFINRFEEVLNNQNYQKYDTRRILKDLKQLPKIVF